jgi:hypothetical protein
MYSMVKRLRERGKRKHQRDIQADSGTANVLTLPNVGGIYEPQLTDRNDSTVQVVIPALYEVVVNSAFGRSLPDLIAIDSETDAPRLGAVREHWDQGALARLEPKIEEAEYWPHCWGQYVQIANCKVWRARTEHMKVRFGSRLCKNVRPCKRNQSGKR